MNVNGLPDSFAPWPERPVTERELQDAREEFAECQREVFWAREHEAHHRLPALLAQKNMLDHRCEWLVVRWIAQGCKEGPRCD